MAQNKDNKPKEEQKENRAQPIPVDVLRNNCTKLWGITTSTFDGAFFNADKEAYTISEAKAKIDKWLKTEVKGV